MAVLDGKVYDNDLRETEFPLSAELFDRASRVESDDTIVQALRTQGMEDLAKMYTERRARHTNLIPLEVEALRMFRHVFRRRQVRRHVNSHKPNGRLCVQDATPLIDRQRYYCSQACESLYRLTEQIPYLRVDKPEENDK